MSKSRNILTLAITALILGGIFMYFTSQSSPPETRGEKYMHRLKNEAQGGYTKAYHLIALEYEKGKIVPQDYTKAREWLQKGADLGFGNAQIDLAKYYYHGLGGEKNLQKAQEWYAKAEELTDITTRHNLGLSYFNGKDIEQDYSKARELFLLITQSPDFANDKYKTETRQATSLLGFIYLKGLGTDRDENEARKWLQIAADKGNESAKEELIKLQKNPDQKAE
ncbi:MAG: sel1 repeat family protein [Alphaproteobacteria bacterium]|nr:sel1 repeat family protein [Alphaproteobacteria bacterium]